MTAKPGHIYRMNNPHHKTLHCLAVDTRPAPGLEDSFGALRVTVTSRHHDFPDWIRLTSGDPCAGYIVVYDYERVGFDEIAEDLGPLSAESATAVREALRRRPDL